MKNKKQKTKKQCQERKPRKSKKKRKEATSGKNRKKKKQELDIGIFVQPHFRSYKKKKITFSPLNFFSILKRKLFNNPRKKLPSPTIYFLLTPPNQTRQ